MPYYFGPRAYKPMLIGQWLLRQEKEYFPHEMPEMLHRYQERHVYRLVCRPRGRPKSTSSHDIRWAERYLEYPSFLDSRLKIRGLGKLLHRLWLHLLEAAARKWIDSCEATQRCTRYLDMARSSYGLARLRSAELASLLRHPLAKSLYDPFSLNELISRRRDFFMRDEGQQVLVHLMFHRRWYSMGSTRIDLQRRTLDDLGRK